MRKTRLAAAGAAAAIALGGTVAAADNHTDTQTVTITVTAAPLTLSLTAGQAVTFSPAVNATAISLSNTTGQLTFHNPAGSDSEFAKVTVARDDTDLSDTESSRALTLAVDADDSGFDEGGGLAVAATWSGATATEQDLITGILRSNDATTGVTLELTLTGDAGSSLISGTALQTTLTYTIVDDPA
jgi:hypothetical protein